ncbi:MAG TPA: MFS transporter [Gaiellaceae bacterium]|nr:MFS transporter [Gaiellaceae bacterium]
MRGVDRRGMGALSLGHLAADLSQGALPALLVYLKPELGLSYTMTAAVVLVATLTSSIVQPLFGLWSDRRGAVWLTSAGVALGGAGIAVGAQAPTYAVLLVLVAVSGLGIGAFHPEAMKLAGHASGARRASGMALFSTGGNVGFALGPLLVTGAIGGLGLHGGLLLLVPGVAVGLVLAHEHVRLEALVGRREQTTTQARPADDRPGAFRLLLAIVALRSVAYYGLFTFVPQFEVARGHSKSYGNSILALVLLAGVAGTLCAGPLADRLGRRTVLLASLLVSPGLIVLYVFAGGLPGAVAVCFAGAVVVSTFSVTIVMSQEYLPTRVAWASGMSVGLAIGLGGVAAVVLGSVADAVDLKAALIGTAIGPALGAALALGLPHDRRERELAPASLS